jgi:PAS domain S-box-containing protein
MNTSNRWTKAALTVMLLALLFGGGWFYRVQEVAMRQQSETDLYAVVRFKAQQIKAWREDRLADAAVLQGNPLFTRQVARFQADPSDENNMGIRVLFQSLSKHYGYADVLLVDPEGRVRLSLSGQTEVRSGYVAALSAALRDRKPVFADLYTEAQQKTPRISVVAPLFTDSEQAPKPIGAVILVCDASQCIYPLIQSWPTPTKTSETVLVRRDGDDVVFLNDLRNQPDSAQKLRIPLSRTDVPAVMAVLGMEGVVMGKDYRSVEVLSVIQPIPDSPWYLVAKMDTVEVFAAWRFRSVLILALLMGMVGMVVLLGFVAIQRERKSHYRALYQSEFSLRASMEGHSITLKAIGDAVITTDARGLVEMLNPVAEALTGWSNEEARGKPLGEVFRIVNEHTRAEVESPVARVLKEGVVVGLANHTLLIGRDGVERPIADSGAPVRADDGTLIGVVLVFRDQSVERRAQRLTKVRLDLIEYATAHTLDEFLTKTLDEVGAFLDSPIGFYHFVESDQETLSLQQWSTRTLKEFCRAEGKGLHYSIDQAGVWVDCVQERKPVIHNDYFSLEHKKGMPEGHVEVLRELVTPVMREGKVVTIMGVGNKPVDYTEKDAETASFLADMTWEIVEHKRAAEMLKDSEKRYRRLFETAKDGILILDFESGRVVDANPFITNLLGYSYQALCEMYIWDIGFFKDIAASEASLKTLQENEYIRYEDLPLQTLDGQRIDVEFVSNVYLVDHTKVIQCNIRDITERKQAEDDLRISLGLLEIMHKQKEIAPLLRQCVSEIKNYTGCDAVGIRVLDEDLNIPYVACQGFSQEFYESESPLSLKSDECMCINVIRGDVDPGLPFYTEGGGFCVNATSRFLAMVSEEEKGRTRNRCNQEGYETVGLFPFRTGDKILGLVHVVDHRENMLPPNRVGMLEKATMQLGTAFERVFAESKLRESEERFSKFFRASPVGTSILHTVDSKFTDVNDAFLGLLDRTQEEVIDHNPIELGIWADPEDRVKMLETLQRQGRVKDFEARFRRKSGEIRNVNFSTEVIEIGDQHYLLGLTHDITDRKRVEESLRDSQLRLELALQSAHMGVWHWDLVKDKHSFDDLVCRLLGIDPAKFTGTADEFFDAVHPDDREMLKAALAQTIEQDAPYETECRAVWPDGSVHYLMTRARLFRDETGQPARVHGLVWDVTEQKRVEKALVEAEAKYRDIFEHSVMGMFQVSVDGHFLTVNAAFARLHGYDSPEEMMHEVESARHLHVHPESLFELTRMIEEHGEVREFQAELFRKDKSVVWASLSVRSVRDSTGGIAYLEGTASDVTEKELLRARLNQAQKLEAIGTLVGGIAHDFNNILQPMVGYTEMALLKLSPSDPVRDDLDQVLQASQRAKELVRQILTISRSSQEQKRIPTDVSSIVKEALKLLRSSLPSSIQMRQKIRKGFALADSTQIHQVLMNLCTNAAHAMGEKGIMEVRLSTANLSQSDLAAQHILDLKPGPHLKLSVSDTGAGMDAKTVERIFEPYFTTKEVGKGSGLGLAVVHGIVKRHEGTITVQSEPGKGTTFNVYIPRIETTAEILVETPHETPIGTECILFLDDEQTLAEMGTAILERLGYKVTAETDSLRALEVFSTKSDEFDLIITDYTMPNLSGLDFAGEVLRIRPNMPIMLCTGFSEKITPDSVKELGVELLMKPYSLRQISEAVRKILDSRKGG